AVQGSMPDAASKRRYVNLVAIQRIGNYPVAPFEVESRNAGPVFPTIPGKPRRGLESGGIKNVRIVRISRNVVHVSVTGKDAAPGETAVFREENASTITVGAGFSCPSSEIQPLRRAGIDCECVRPIHSIRKANGMPMLCPIPGAIKGAIVGIANAAVFGAPGNYRIQGPVRSEREAPSERLLLRNSAIFQRPSLASVCALVYAPPKTG